jgi:hypothetical protein
MLLACAAFIALVPLSCTQDRTQESRRPSPGSNVVRRRSSMEIWERGVVRERRRRRLETAGLPFDNGPRVASSAIGRSAEAIRMRRSPAGLGIGPHRHRVAVFKHARRRPKTSVKRNRQSPAQVPAILLRQLRRQPWRIQRDVFLHAWPPLHQEPDVGVRGVEVDLELVERAAPAPDIQPLRYIHQRRPLRIDAECVSIA